MNIQSSLNFSAGPGALPLQVLKEARDAIAQAPGTNQSILGISHRSDWFKNIVQESEQHFRNLLNIPENYHILHLQGGSTLQFSMIPILLLRGKNKTAEYLRTGYWSTKSIPDAEREGNVKIIYDGETNRFSTLPNPSELQHDPEAAYFHYVSNETVEGLQFHSTLGLDSVPRICDMSSDFLSRPFPIENFDLIYAHAQKNLGPSGLTIVIIKDSLLQGAPENVHTMLDYRNHIEMKSAYNTPPVFAIYVTLLVSRWLADIIGGVENMGAINDRKANALYSFIDAHSEFYRLHVKSVEHRSKMNIAFRLPDEELERKFLQEAKALGFYGLEGHRSLGGLRASLYNAVKEEDVNKLVEFMSDFYKRQN